jgi:hypothetical protein
MTHKKTQMCTAAGPGRKIGRALRRGPQLVHESFSSSAKHSGILLFKIRIRTMHFLLMVCYAEVGYAGVAEILIFVLT